MAFNASWIFTLKDRFSKQAERIEARAASLKKQIDSLKKSSTNTARGIDKVRASAKKIAPSTIRQRGASLPAASGRRVERIKKTGQSTAIGIERAKASVRKIEQPAPAQRGVSAYGKSRQQIDGLKKSAKSLSAAFLTTAKQAGSLKTALADLTAATMITSKELQKATRSAITLENRMGALGANISHASSGFSTAQRKAAKFNEETAKTSEKSRRAARSIDGLKESIKKTRLVTEDGVSRFSRFRASINASAKSFSNFSETASRASRKALTIIGLSTALIGGPVVSASAKLETLELSFVSLVGSVEKAKDTIKSLAQFTAKTPFQIDGVASASRQLIAAGVDIKNLQDRLRVLGDISAVSNVPLTDMSAIFAKIKNKNKAMTEELLQLSDRGIPILDILAKGFNTQKNTIFEMASQGKISFDVILKSFQKMTAQGGFAAGATERLSKSTAGLFSTLKDNIFLQSAAIGDQLSKTLKLKENIQKLTEAVAKYGPVAVEWIKNNEKTVKLIAKIVAAVAGLAVVGLTLSGLALAFGPIFGIVSGLVTLFTKFGKIAAFAKKVVKGLAAAFRFLSTVIRVLAVVIRGLMLFLTANPIVAGITIAVIALGFAVNWLVERFGGWKKVFDIIVDRFKQGVSFWGKVFNFLIDRVKQSISFLKKLASVAKDVFSGLFKVTVAPFVKIFDFLKGIFGDKLSKTLSGTVSSAISKIKSAVSLDAKVSIDKIKNPPPQTLDIKPETRDIQSPKQRDLSILGSLDINIKGNSEKIESVKSRNFGDIPMNMGVNFAGT